MKLSITPAYDSYNSDAPYVSFERSPSGKITISLSNQDRVIVINRADWESICKLFPGAE